MATMVNVSTELIIGLTLLTVTLAGGVAGTISSLRACRGARERRFVIRAFAGIWSLFAAFVASVVFLPSPYRWVAGGILLVLMPVLIYRWATQHQLIRILEERAASERTTLEPPDVRNVPD